MQNLKRIVRKPAQVLFRGRGAHFPAEVDMRQSIMPLLAALSFAALAPTTPVTMSSAYAQTQSSQPKLQEGAPDRYIVEKGDTLWSIASRFLKEPWRWQELWRLNRDQIKNPHRIYPGNVIVLDRSKSPAQLSLLPTVKLSPSIRREPAEADAIPSIPANKIEPFLTQPLVIEEDGLTNAPRIVATEENRVHLGVGGVAYVSGLGESKAAVWEIFRPGRPLVDPDSQKTLGFEAIFLGTARVLKPGEPATLQIISSKQEITRGDRLVASAGPVINQYAPHPPGTFLRARIISLYDRLVTSEGGKDSIVALNKGRRDGVENGHVLAIYRAGMAISDQRTPRFTLPWSSAKPREITLPDERYGIVFVFRVFDSVSYGLVMESSRPVTPGDIAQTP